MSKVLLKFLRLTVKLYIRFGLLTPAIIYYIQYIIIVIGTLLLYISSDSISDPDINPDKSCNCSGELLRWTAPSILPNYEIYNCSKEVNKTYQTNNTWIFIPYSDLELHRQYEILISASYCAGDGNETSVSIVTSIG